MTSHPIPDHNPPPQNPYQPSRELSAVAAWPENSGHDEIRSWTVYWVTTVCVILSGVVFGMGLSMCVFGFRLFMEGLAVKDTQMLIFIPIAGALGGAMALLAAVPTVAAMAIVKLFVQSTPHWTRFQIRRFAFIAGSLSGILSVAVPARFDGDAVGVSLIPGCCGGVLSVLLIQFLARRAPLTVN